MDIRICCWNGIVSVDGCTSTTDNDDDITVLLEERELPEKIDDENERNDERFITNVDDPIISFGPANNCMVNDMTKNENLFALFRFCFVFAHSFLKLVNIVNSHIFHIFFYIFLLNFTILIVGMQ